MATPEKRVEMDEQTWKPGFQPSATHCVHDGFELQMLILADE
jgi:hypothetical protein